MATLAEAGLSENLGLSNQSGTTASQPVAVFHYAINEIYSLRDRMASGFLLQKPITQLQPDQEVNIGSPAGSVDAFKQPRSRLSKPVFFSPYYTNKFAIKSFDDVILDGPDSAIISSRGDLVPFTESYVDRSQRGPNYVLMGSNVLRSFFESSLGVLDIGAGAKTQDTDEGQQLVGDDLIASRLIQLAGICDIDIKRSIPPSHLDRALVELVTTTLFRNYFWLCIDENIGTLSGSWHFACRKFAASYGIEAEEIADVALEFSEAARVNTERRTSQKRPLPPLEPSTARRMGEYLVTGN